MLHTSPRTASSRFGAHRARLGAITLGVSALVVPSAIVAQPAHAAGRTVTTSVSLAATSSVVPYGDKVYLLADAASANSPTGTDQPAATGDTIRLERRIGNGPWTALQQGSDNALWTTRVKKKASYRVVYSGGTSKSADGSTITWLPATSPTITVRPSWRIKDRLDTSGFDTRLKGTVSPKFRGKAVLQKRQGKRWVSEEKFRLARGKRFDVVLPDSGRYRLVVPSRHGIAKASVTYRLTLKTVV